MTRKRPTPDDPAVRGEAWRGEMRPDRETLPALVWKRVHRAFGIDLSDPRQATGLQVYRMLHEVMTLCAAPEADDDPGVNVTVAELEIFVDVHVPRVFRQ